MERVTIDTAEMVFKEFQIDNNLSKEEIVKIIVQEYLYGHFANVLSLNNLLLRFDAGLTPKTYFNLAKEDSDISFDEVTSELERLDEEGNPNEIFKYLYGLGMNKRISRDQLILIFQLASLEDESQKEFLYEVMRVSQGKAFEKYCKKMYKMINSIKLGRNVR